jgi:hypothetical protein
MSNLYPSYLRRSFASLFGLFILASLLAVPAHGQVGQSSALFLRIEPDSRASGMGNTGVALADDANAMFWNPSGLAFQKNTQVGLSHGNWLPEFDANLFYEFLVASHHVEDVGTFGANVTFLNLGTTERRDAQGNRLGETNSFQLAASASYGVKVTDRLGLGTSVRFVQSQLASAVGEGTGDGSASTLATDLSAMYRTAPFTLGGTDAEFSAGLNIANLGGTLDFNEQELGSDPIPASFRFGPALTLDFDEFNSLTIATDFTKSLVSSDLEVQDGDTARVGNSGFQALFDSWGSAKGQLGPNNEATSLSLVQQFTVGTGLEYWYNDLFALRSGYYYEHPDNGDRQFLTFGAGLRYNIVGVDISYLFSSDDNSPLANTLRFSVMFDFQ